MSSVITIVRASIGVFALAILFSLTTGFGQSRDINNPTPIATFPITGTLGSSTYYYQIPEAMVSPGRANVVLDLTPPDGGASMTVTLSGRRCCPPAAYLGVTTGLADRTREATAFDIPAQQDLLVTVYISVAAKHTVGYRINFNIGATSSGIVVTRPRPPLTPATPTFPDGSVCTDLGVIEFAVNSITERTKQISGVVQNYSATPFKSSERGQWLQVFDITDSAREPVRLLQTRIPTHMDPGSFFRYSVRQTPTGRTRPRYQVKIVYGHWLATDRSQYNDDCNAANDSTTRQRGVLP